MDGLHLLPYWSLSDSRMYLVVFLQNSLSKGGNEHNRLLVLFEIICLICGLVYHRLLGADALCASGDCVIADYVLWSNKFISLSFCSLLSFDLFVVKGSEID
ncbi:hypothetical protein PIB30_068529 [Stylosanthes scabra]|uniref:Uncharacterized protein n=1 Tax=Stylosanthes scabra TaxID=79078 RepID=A0ABU6ULP6_9FABA|nr:hypothetical protein [Stylosanthes scabra]